MKIALIGYGKMGRMVEEIARRRGHEIVCIIDVDNQDEFESERFASADVAIEFTSPTSAYGNYLRAFAHNVKVVSGSTGWKAEHGEDVRRMCEEEGKTLFWASNFSVGVAVFDSLNRYLADIMNRFADYDVSMEETHHIHKLDAPSGTAVSLAEGIISRLERKQKWVLKEHAGQAVSPEELPITAIREGEVTGIHTVRYESMADCITLTHEARSREGFALGAVLAAEYTEKHSGLLTISDMFPF
ncbi:MAG: 4-hydroxy-tetrahydrodipicolinate reductase [Prevotella sp.]|nr:4-hydroxy-tetrahydrodipicolinate reductase [Prevotella sp.]